MYAEGRPSNSVRVGVPGSAAGTYGAMENLKNLYNSTKPTVQHPDFLGTVSQPNKQHGLTNTQFYPKQST